MATDPPALDPPTTRSRLVEAFASMELWGEHGPAAMQAILDALDVETVPAVDSLDDLENVESTDLPYVIKGSDRSPGDLPDQAVPTGSQLKQLSETISRQISAIESSKLETVGSITDISNPSDGDRYHVAQLDTTVEYDGNREQFDVKGQATVSAKSKTDLSLDPDDFKPGTVFKSRTTDLLFRVVQ